MVDGGVISTASYRRLCVQIITDSTSCYHTTCGSTYVTCSGCTLSSACIVYCIAVSTCACRLSVGYPARSLLSTTCTVRDTIVATAERGAARSRSLQ